MYYGRAISSVEPNLRCVSPCSALTSGDRREVTRPNMRDFTSHFNSSVSIASASWQLACCQKDRVRDDADTTSTPGCCHEFHRPGRANHHKCQRFCPKTQGPASDGSPGGSARGLRTTLCDIFSAPLQNGHCDHQEPGGCAGRCTGDIFAGTFESSPIRGQV